MTDYAHALRQAVRISTLRTTTKSSFIRAFGAAHIIDLLGDLTGFAQRALLGTLAGSHVCFYHVFMLLFAMMDKVLPDVRILGSQVKKCPKKAIKIASLYRVPQPVTSARRITVRTAS